MDKKPVVIAYLENSAVFDYAKIEEYCGVPASLITEAVNGTNKLNRDQVRILEWFLQRIGVDYKILEQKDSTNLIWNDLNTRP
ncbi:hypothetical protein MD537_06930 [Flavihumibacter sediminis]|nr:hypothetical protein [Flavihumibacter sediminis]